MRDNYDISKLNPKKNPYAGKLKRQVTINLKSTTVDYFKKLADETGIPYQNLIDLYLDDCVKKGIKPDIKWQKPA
ncbi:antitoxin [Butyrivibrio sp. AE2032]|uniref:antitoxin n=1 Tax=Butyrivibrio sp. AE2032 TaxID=1458463 RepID=UPI000554CCFF|nr:antitoxin [Butyrivibrio sp. AE2032]